MVPFRARRSSEVALGWGGGLGYGGLGWAAVRESGGGPGRGPATVPAMTRIAVLGAGKIGEALLSGLLASGRPASELVFTERHAERAAELTERLGIASADVAGAAAAADVVVVAVKPQDIAPVLGELKGAIRPGTLVVSLCAGLPTALFEGGLPDGTPVVRVMPNTPMLVGEAMSAVSPGAHATAEHVGTVVDMLAAVGRVVQVPESQQDAVTALSGSGPAYFFFLVEAMIDAGILLGLPRAVAADLIVQSAYGAASMMRESDDHPVLLREAVTSPAGTTIAAIRELERHGVRAALIAAIEAARDRSVELGRSVQAR
ncbi:pyrroline-5-carboxylate reductase [Pseudonocardia benzenivorans]|nr:pyrroline-5-carboxylate reductase [Pseudonocardia sp. D17]